MTTVPPSRLTLSNLIPLIQNGDFPPTGKRDLVSAVKAVARILGADPTAVDFH
jgi:hypothetical protein